jgi:hypothetical protein
MRYQEILSLLFVGVIVSSCGWNLNAPDDGNGGTDPDTTAIFQNVSSSNLPSELSGTTQKTKAADLDGDGDLDLVLAIPFAANNVLFNDGTGSFSDESSRLPNQDFDTQDLVAADFDNDGDSDLFFASNQSLTNELYINDGDGNFSDLSNRIPIAGNSTSVAALDIDGSGTIDIMIGNLGQNVMLMNSGNAFFTNQTTERLPQRTDATQDIAFGDITGDNLQDIIIANENENKALINTGSGFFADQTINRIPFNNSIEETRDVELVDVDGDGNLDIYFGNSGFQTNSNPQDRLLISNGQGSFTDRTADQLPAITTHTFDAEFADLDGDGNFDLVIGIYNGGIRVFSASVFEYMPEDRQFMLDEVYQPIVRDNRIYGFLTEGYFKDIGTPESYREINKEFPDVL